MMNVIPKASTTDLSGLLALAAFLADKDACLKRLAELQAAVAKAEAAEQSALEMQESALRMQDKAAAVVKAAEDRHQATLLAAAAVEAHEITAAKKAEALRAEGDRLAAWQNSLDAAAQEFKLKVAELSEREDELAAAEAKLEAASKAHDARVARIKAAAE